MNHELYTRIGNLETRIQEIQKVPRDIQSTLNESTKQIKDMQSLIRILQNHVEYLIDKADNTPDNTFTRLRVLKQSIATNSTCIHVLEEKFDHLMHSL
jgi:peptidoglycan hydrolase CwlO-like protein